MRLSRFCSSILLASIVALGLVGCGKLGGGKITGPGGNGQVLPWEVKVKWSAPSTVHLASGRIAPFSAEAAQIDFPVTPGPQDSVILLGTLSNPTRRDWQGRLFIGFMRADGTLDRRTTLFVPAMGEDYQFFVVFVHHDEVTGKRYEVPLIGSYSINGTPVTAVDHTVYIMWYTFRLNRGADGQIVVDQIRDDTGKVGFYECVATGVYHPDSALKNRPVTGADMIEFFSTGSRLVSLPSVFVEGASGGVPASSWRTFVWCMRGKDHLVRANYPDGSPVLGGVQLKNASGSWAPQCQNFFDLDPAPNGFYPAFIMKLGDDGAWSNPFPNRDDRWGRIDIGRLRTRVSDQERSRWVDQAMMAQRGMSAQRW